jgi:ATP-dependent Clp protease ATP-binding subunit ClpB
LAQTKGHIEVTPLHLASVLFSDPNQLGVQLLQKAQVSGGGTHVTVEGVQESIAKALKKLPSQDPPPSDLRMSARFVKVLQAAQKLQKAQKDSHTAVDHLLLALYEDPDVSAALSSVGLTKRKMEDAAKAMRGTRKVTGMNAEATYGKCHNLLRIITLFC